MEKSLFTAEYAVMLTLLRETRQHAGLTQVQLAERLGQSQSFVSKVERGETRLDLIQLRTICQSAGTSLQEFVAALEGRLTRPTRARRRKN